jgi:phage terminase large subunit-like protein
MNSKSAESKNKLGGLEGFAAFCQELTLEDGRSFQLEDFQRQMLADYFGGATESLILLSKKNGKSTLLSALALHHLLVTEDAECVIAAASRDQATILYDQAAGFVRRSPMLPSLVDVKRGYREIRAAHHSGRIRVLAADVDTADGVIPTLALVDELHRHKSADLYGVFRDGLGPRQGRMVTISTAGDDDSSPLGVMRANARSLPLVEQDGGYWYCRSEDASFVMHEWALSEDDDLADMALVKTVNPASWQTPAALGKRHDSPSMTRWQWARFACGVWLRGEGAAITPGEWDELREKTKIPDGAPVYIGVDLGWKIDTTALVPLQWESTERRVVSDVVVLEPPGDGTLLDDRLITQALLDLAARFEVLGVIYDPNAGGQQMIQALNRKHSLPFIEHSQQNSPIAVADARLMEAIRRKELVHDGDKVLREHVLNAVEKPLGGEQFRFDRPKRGERKPIDALRALSMVHSVAFALHEEPDEGFLLVA